MKEILRNTLAAMAGAMVGVLLISLLQLASAKLHPLPAGIDPADKAAMGEFIRTLPASAKLLVLLSYFVGVSGGSWLAGRLSLTSHRRQAGMVAVLFAVASLLNLMSFPHPVWFWVANFAAVFAGAWLAQRFLGPQAASAED